MGRILGYIDMQSKASDFYKRIRGGMFNVLLIVFLATSALLIRSMVLSDVNENEPYSIFILAGQSNAEGSNSYWRDLEDDNSLKRGSHPADTQTGFWWAGANGNGPQEDDEITKYFNTPGSPGWTNSGVGEDDKFQDLTDVQLKDQFGSEVGAARELYDKGRRKVVFLKVTYGFQSLAQSGPPFIPYDWNTESSNKSYDRLKLEFDELTQYIRDEGSTYTVDGIFWMQGETDTLQGSYAAAYKENFEKLIAAMKSDLQLHPQGQIVAGKISLKTCVDGSYPLTGNYCGAPFAKSVNPLAVEDNLSIAHAAYTDRQKLVRDTIQDVADADPDGLVSVVETADLERGFDYIHLDEFGQLELGRRFVNMYTLPLRFNSDDPIVGRSVDYDLDGILNADEDNGRGVDEDGNPCPLAYSNVANNGNLGDDDSDCDGYPDYLDRKDGVGSGL